MNRLLALCVLAAATSVVLAQDPAPAPSAPAAATASPEIRALQKQVADLKVALDAKLREIQQQLDSISKFLGDQNASTFDSLDRRLRDMERNIEEIKDDVRR